MPASSLVTTSPRTVSSTVTPRCSHHVLDTVRVLIAWPAVVDSTIVPLTPRQPGWAGPARRSLR